MTTISKNYWIDVDYDGNDYELGADLAWDGEYYEDDHGYVITKEPEFCDFVVFDPITGDPMAVDTLFLSVTQVAYKHLCNVYWNETLGS
jgi:hypothetical protein